MRDQVQDVSQVVLESLWVRLKAGHRVRLRDGLLLRRLGVPPFDKCLVFETDAQGYVMNVGMPESMCPVRAKDLLTAFEARFGVFVVLCLGTHAEIVIELAVG